MTTTSQEGLQMDFKTSLPYHMTNDGCKWPFLERSIAFLDFSKGYSFPYNLPVTLSGGEAFGHPQDWTDRLHISVKDCTPQRSRLFPEQSSVTNQSHLSESKPSQVEKWLVLDIIRSREMGKGRVPLSFSKSEDTDPADRKIPYELRLVSPLSPAKSGLGFDLQAWAWPWTRSDHKPGAAKDWLRLRCPLQDVDRGKACC